MTSNRNVLHYFYNGSTDKTRCFALAKFWSTFRYFVILERTFSHVQIYVNSMMDALIRNTVPRISRHFIVIYDDGHRNWPSRSVFIFDGKCIYMKADTIQFFTLIWGRKILMLTSSFMKLPYYSPSKLRSLDTLIFQFLKFEIGPILLLTSIVELLISC